MAADRFLTRRRKLLARIRAEKLDALLVTSVVNVTYLTGFTGDSSYLLLGPDVETLISDTRYDVQIQEECPGLAATYIRDSSEKIDVSAGKVVGKAGLRKIGFESETTSHAQWGRFQKNAEQVEWVPTSQLVEKLRMVKDAAEVAEIRRAVQLAERAFRKMVASLHPRMTEREASFELEDAIRRFGGEGVAFHSIIAVGDRAALPHYYPGERRIEEAGFLLVDWGALSPGGYRSDLTRIVATRDGAVATHPSRVATRDGAVATQPSRVATRDGAVATHPSRVATGRLSPKLEKVYKVVLSAQEAAIAAMKPGAACKDVDAVAREIIKSAGYGNKFGHGLGHGIGLEIHEEPRMSPISEDVLEPGMVVTVEPGIYLPGWGGVRIEDDVLITKSGCEVLTSVPKQPDEIPAA
jgi:Xaa-Pro aminopeptidase